MENKKIQARVSKLKIETVKKLVELMKNNNTLIITSIKNLPSKQFQNIRKTLRGKADVIVVKKRIMLKAIDESGNKNIQSIKEHVCEDSAILFSKEDAFELASILANNKKPIGAKPGQTANEDISVEEGGTDIMPGPAISEFGALGIPIAVEDGKIAIKQSKVIVKAGEEISEAAASIMGKLEIKPFNIGLEPIALCDIQTGKIYLDVKIDKEKATKDLQTGAGKALGFAQTIAYYCKETIGYLLAKANSQADALSILTSKYIFPV
jgi:large subunit ribosomal protein L10